MSVLVIGGSGYVGTGVLPFLVDQYDITVFDLKPPKVDGVGYIQGSIFDREALSVAIGSCDSLIFMAMATENKDGPTSFEHYVEGNVLAVYRTLEAVAESNIRHVVHTSSVSVHDESRTYFESEDLPMDARGPYGLSKAMGEMVCRQFVHVQKLSVIALRLYAPTPPEVWRHRMETDERCGYTTFRDTARAYAAALEKTDHHGFDAVFISGDPTGRYVNCSKAREFLGWEPIDRLPR